MEETEAAKQFPLSTLQSPSITQLKNIWIEDSWGLGLSPGGHPNGPGHPPQNWQCPHSQLGHPGRWQRLRTGNDLDGRLLELPWDETSSSSAGISFLKCQIWVESHWR